MIIFGAVYFALPRITNREIPKGAKSFHFWTSTFGVLLLLLAYLIGGLTHGVLAGQPSLPWSSSVIQSIQPYFLITKIAFVILAFFFLNSFSLLMCGGSFFQARFLSLNL